MQKTQAMAICHELLSSAFYHIMRLIYFALLFTSILVSCDPARRINMRNQSAQDVEIIWTIKEDSIHSSHFFISNSKEFKLELKPNTPSVRINMSFGVGTWTPLVIKNLADDLESMLIRWGEHEIKLDTEEKIGDYLMSRRKGIGRRQIWIVVKE
jgi:hypothetical protein